MGIGKTKPGRKKACLQFLCTVLSNNLFLLHSFSDVQRRPYTTGAKINLSEYVLVVYIL